MKFLTFVLFSMIICFGIFPKVNAQTNAGKAINKLPVIDKEKSYPEKDFKPEIETIYIPMETSKDILLDQGAHIYYVSETRILIADWQTCNVFIFNMNGKALSHFNVRGGMGVSMISYVVYDEQNKEVFILGKHNKKIVVYNDEGMFKRTLHLPSDLFIEEIQNFNETSLLALQENMDENVKQLKPYIFISKKDGSILSKLNITFNKINPSVNITNGLWTRMKNDHSGSCKFGKEFIIANMSSDTIYMIKQDMTVVPLFVQNPTVFSDPPVITSVGMKTKDIITFAIYPFDLKKAAKRSLNGDNRPIKEEVRFLTYEFKTGQFYEHKKRVCWAEKVDISENMGVEFIYPWRLINSLKLGVLEGKLKELATSVKIDDNPIIKITKFK